MFSRGFNEQFAETYDFVDFIHATGLQSPLVGDAFKAFKLASWQYILEAGLGALSECFEIWIRNQTEYTID